MTSAVGADLEAALQALLSLKPPGVSGSRIANITNLCVDNVSSESLLIQKIYTHFKKAPGTHKLGVLYVVDSVTRKWLERAKAQGQTVDSAAQDGSPAAGVFRVTELMPVLMNDILSSAPDGQKEKIKKLVDIWEKGQTFPSAMISSFREKMAAQPPIGSSTTPTNSPPPDLAKAFSNPPAPSAHPPLPSTGPVPDSSAIMEALANIARQNSTAVISNPSVPAPIPGYQNNMLSQKSTPVPVPAPAPAPAPSLAPAPASILASLGYPSAPPVSVPGLPFSFPPQAHPQAQPGVMSPVNPYGAMPGMPTALSPHPPQGSVLDANTQQQLLLIQALHAQGVPFDQIPTLIQSMNGLAGIGAAPSLPLPGQTPLLPAPASQTWANVRPDESRDRDDGRGVAYRGRSRSRSPGRRDKRDSPRGGVRDRYGDYDQNSPGRDRDRGRRGDYRQRSPAGRRDRSQSPQSVVQKWVEYDPTLPSGHIKVFSRTLFVGGVTCPESELRGLFSRHGEVQTCIVNKDKRHAFVKMISREDAVRAKKEMEDVRTENYHLRTRWGVGFGPRDCSDYATGISIIPIQKLTEADRKWMLTAEYGGSGGRSIEHGLVVEEPDIEIGAGVSSKAISRRMQTDKGGVHGPKSTRNREGDDDSSTRWRRGRDRDRGDRDRDRDREPRDSRRDDGPSNKDGPLSLGYPFLAGLPNGMAHFPGAFGFPAPEAEANSTK